ncbi:unknown [Bovine gammaherpesvirus 4]|uniref:Uncharacterized protein BORF 30 n=3 Tax=Bovine herpesvirus 4 TaxID=10385 RepID=Q9WI07_BHV4|nr:unknown [Bovine gammaherpesvirus 4]AAD33782.1 unknown [Bovine gammaherpesvirus 4]AAK07948.1 unknown [Bovine gammaherpesvirus 4]AEL29774.1 hypothetical protein [Bovine gammaherpesvirus 4]AIA82775.1 hypothetical protein [Bovine gammaherpesvirus 4]QJC19141.1 hypothetical protein [Bovine gammaherpesvirus 4]
MDSGHLTEKDFSDCKHFFSQPLKHLIDDGSRALNDIDLNKTVIHNLERLSLLLDLVGTECLSKVTKSTDAQWGSSTPPCV